MSREWGIHTTAQPVAPATHITAPTLLHKQMTQILSTSTIPDACVHVIVPYPMFRTWPSTAEARARGRGLRRTLHAEPGEEHSRHLLPLGNLEGGRS